MQRRVTIHCVVGVGGLLFIAGCGPLLRQLIAPGAPPTMNMPVELKNPGIVVGAGFLSKKLFLQNTKIGRVTDIVSGELDATKKNGDEIGIAGSQGALLVDKNGRAKSSVKFAAQAAHVDIVDVERDGLCEYLNRGAWVVAASLMNHQGKVVWTHSSSPGVDDTAAGDINGDGKLEFVVGFNGGGGVSLLGTNGKQVWNQPDGNVWHVEIVDANRDGRLDIVHSNASGQITVRNAKGRVLNRAKPSVYFSHFSLCRWPNATGSPHALLSENNKIWLLNFNGRVAARFNAPRSASLGDTYGVPIKLQTNQPTHLAVVVDFEMWNRAVFYVYNAAGTLVYQEVLPESCAAIASLSISKSSGGAILLGGQGKVWRYSLPSRKA